MKENDIKILMFDAAFPPPIIGGKEKQAYILSKSIIDKGIEIDAFSFFFSTEHSNGEVEVNRFDRSFFGYIAFFIALVQVRRKKNIIHIHTPSKIGRLTLLVSKLVGYKVMFKIPNQGMFSRKKSMLDEMLWSFVFKLADRFAVLEKDSLEFLEGKGVRQERLFYTPNGVVISEENLNNEAESPFKILYVGRLVEQKRVDDLLEAVSKLDNNKSFCVEVVGDGLLLSDLKEKTRKLGVNERVTFYGHVDNNQVTKFIKESDVIVLPSEKEGMSNSLLEAMSYGLPILATNVGSKKKLLGKYYSKCTFEVGEVNQLKESLLYLMNDRDERDRYGKYLRDRCKRKFDIEVIADNYIIEYKKMINNG